MRAIDFVLEKGEEPPPSFTPLDPAVGHMTRSLVTSRVASSSSFSYATLYASQHQQFECFVELSCCFTPVCTLMPIFAFSFTEMEVPATC